MNLQEVPPHIQDIQPFPSQVCNFDDIVFDMNIIWYKMVCSYKFFRGDRIWRIHTFERAPLWCTVIISNLNNEQCLIPPEMLHHSTHSITTHPVILYPKINGQYIWITMCGLSVTLKVELITRLYWIVPDGTIHLSHNFHWLIFILFNSNFRFRGIVFTWYFLHTFYFYKSPST